MSTVTASLKTGLLAGLTLMAMGLADLAEASQAREAKKTGPRGASFERSITRTPGAAEWQRSFARPNGAGRSLEHSRQRGDGRYEAQGGYQRQFFDGTSRGFAYDRTLDRATGTAQLNGTRSFRDGTSIDGSRTIQKVDEGVADVTRSVTGRNGETATKTKTVTRPEE